MLCILYCTHVHNVLHYKISEITSNLVAIVGRTRGQLQLPWELGNIAQYNTKADILIENRLWPPLDMVTVDQERELHVLDIWTKRVILLP